MNSAGREKIKGLKASSKRQQAEINCISKNIAVLRLHLPDGAVLTNQLLKFDERGQLVTYYPLKSELAFCEWYRGDWYCENSI